MLDEHIVIIVAFLVLVDIGAELEVSGIAMITKLFDPTGNHLVMRIQLIDTM